MVETNSERFMRRRSVAPVATRKMATSVTPYRRTVLDDEVASGQYREEGSSGQYQIPGRFGTTEASHAVSSSFRKYAQTSSLGAGGAAGTNSFRGPGGAVRQVPEIYSPLWLTSNLNLPRDRATINAWCRAFFALNPIVQNAISLHSTYPISKLNIRCKNKKIEDFFANMAEEIDLMNVCTQLAQEYWTLGEAFVYAEIDENAGKWDRLIIQNPDYIVVKHSVVAGEPIISLRPDENLKRIVTSNRPADVQQRKRLDQSIIEHVKRGENIPLSNFYASHLARKISPYEIRGTGLVVSCFRQLMLFDLLRESKFAQAYNLINPVTLIKVGGESYKPSPADLEAWRELWESAQYDKDFKIFCHEQVVVERIGAQGAIIDIANDVTQLMKEIYIGLLVPQVLMDGGADVTYANGGVTLDVLRQRYMQFRNMLSAWLRRKIFAPISKINDFYEYTDGEKVLIVPEVEWNHMSLFDTTDYIQALSQLVVQGETKKASLQTLYRSMGLDWEDEVRRIKEESIEEQIMAKESEIMAKMDLNELRSLGPDDEIQEPAEQPLPGEAAGGEGVGGEEAGMGDMGLPGMPPGAPPDLGAPPEMPPMEGGGGEAAEAPAAAAEGGGGEVPAI